MNFKATNFIITQLVYTLSHYFQFFHADHVEHLLDCHAVPHHNDRVGYHRERNTMKRDDLFLTTKAIKRFLYYADPSIGMENRLLRRLQ